MLTTDFHIHTVMSGHAFCTFNECIEAAQNNKLALIAITDHGPSMEHSAHEGYFEMSTRLPKRFGTLGVLFGCEANILNREGDIDLSTKTMSGLDIVLVGLHEKTPYDGISESDNTNALINSMRQYQSINIISHPFRAEFPISVSDVVYASIEYNVLLEINTPSLLCALMNRSEAKSVQVIKRTAEMVEILQANNTGYIINSDAHHSSEIGICTSTLGLLSQELGISSEYVLNDKPDLLKKYIPALETG